MGREINRTLIILAVAFTLVGAVYSFTGFENTLKSWRILAITETIGLALLWISLLVSNLVQRRRDGS